MTRKVPMPKLPKDFAALIYVHFGLLAMAFGAAWFVHTQSTALPLMDEWDLLREWADDDSAWHWIWMHHNEHRYPFTKAIWIGTLKLTGYNFAAPQYLTFALLFSSALLMLWTARGLRGRSHPVDLVFPALFLHFGHGFNLQMGYQVGFVFFTYCAAGWLWCAGRLAQGGGNGWAVASTIYAALMIPCGGFGLVFTPIVAFWLIYLGRRARIMGKPALRWYCFALASLAVAYSGWIALTMPKQSAPGASPLEQPGEFLTGALGYLASAFGTWPLREGSEPWWIVAIASLTAVAYAVGVQTLANRLDGLDPRRVAIVAILLAIVGIVLVGAAAAAARGGGMAERYTSSSAVGAAAVLLGVSALGPMRISRRADWLAGGLALAFAIGLQYANHEPSVNQAFQMRDAIHALNRDIPGESPLFIGGRHGGTPGVLVGESMAADLRSYRRAGIPAFDRMPADPAYRTHPLPPLPQMDWRMSEAGFRAGESVPEAKLPDPPVGAFGLRVRATTVKSGGNHKLILRWTDAISGAAHESYAHPHYHSGVAMHLAFRLTGAPTRVRLMAGSAIEGLEIGEPEWLVGEGDR